ncbi:restriction alleviation protein, Lar family, partial [[Ruminococcus] torques]
VGRSSIRRASMCRRAAGESTSSMSTDDRKVEDMSEHILKPCPFCGSESMLGEVRPATRKSPPLFGITCIHCGAEMTDEFVPELIQRWNTRVTATASIDKEVMEGAFDKERRDVAARLWKHIGKPLFTGQDVEDIIGVLRSDFDVVLADASYRRLADLIEPEPERTCGEFEEA